jgi:hypothetical protein
MINRANDHPGCSPWANDLAEARYPSTNNSQPGCSS